MEEKNPIQVADRLFGAVEYLAGRSDASLAEIADALSLNKSTAHRIVTSLIYMGYAAQDPRSGRYALTTKLVALSQQIMMRLDIVGMVKPYLTALMERTGETVHFVRRDGLYAVYIDKIVSSQNSIQMVSQIGSRIPLYCSGVGKAMVSVMPDDEVRSVWKASPVKALTPHTITTFAAFSRVLAKARADGYAEDIEENELGVRCVAAPVVTADGRCEYAFSISAPVSRMTEAHLEEIREAILDTKKKISAAVGGAV